MEEKITIGRVNNSCDLLTPETHSIGANLRSDSAACIIVFPEHKKDELGNFNVAARNAFEEYLKDKDLTPKKKQNLYSGKILFVELEHEDNKYTHGVTCWEVINGLIPSLYLLDQDLRIEVDMPCSKLTERISDMYFDERAWSKRNKAMYLTYAND